MKTLARLSILFLAGCAALPLLAAKAPPFVQFAGDYSEHGTVQISNGPNSNATGTADLHFKNGHHGTGRLRITGTIALKDGTRAFSALYIFQLRNKAGHRKARFTNLAPGVDDGIEGDGLYKVTPRTIRAYAPLSIGDATGNATLLMRLVPRPTGIQLLVIETLTITTLDHPIVWRFSGHTG